MGPRGGKRVRAVTLKTDQRVARERTCHAHNRTCSKGTKVRVTFCMAHVRAGGVAEGGGVGQKLETGGKSWGRIVSMM